MTLPDATGFSDPTPMPTSLARALTPTCATIRQGDDLLIALTPEGNDAARVTRANAWTLIQALEQFVGERVVADTVMLPWLDNDDDGA